MPEESLLLDTHCWVWMQLGLTGHFSPVGRSAIEKAAAGGTLCVSAISVWEVGMLEAKGRLALHRECMEWVREALATPGLSLIPLRPEISVQSSRLPGEFHGDPADRILVATARVTGARLMTSDRKILAYLRQRHAALIPA